MTNRNKVTEDHLLSLLNEHPNDDDRYEGMNPNDYVADRIRLLKGSHDDHGLVSIRRIAINCNVRSEYIHHLISQNISPEGRRNIGEPVSVKFAEGTYNFFDLKYMSPKLHERLKKIAIS